MDVLAWIALVLALLEIPFGPHTKPNPYAWRLVVTEIVETESIQRVVQFHPTEAQCLKALAAVAPELNPRCERERP